jgi:HEAT repeat protein
MSFLGVNPRVALEFSPARRTPMRTVAELIADLNHTDPVMRMMAAESLIYKQPPPAEALQPLIEALDDPVDSVRGNAVIAIGGFGPAAKDALPLLQMLVDKGDFVAQNARVAIRRINGG